MRDNQREAVGAAHSPQSHIKVGITHGDTNGVGYELIFQTFGNLHADCLWFSADCKCA